MSSTPIKTKIRLPIGTAADWTDDSFKGARVLQDGELGILSTNIGINLFSGRNTTYSASVDWLQISASQVNLRSGQKVQGAIEQLSTNVDHFWEELENAKQEVIGYDDDSPESDTINGAKNKAARDAAQISSKVESHIPYRLVDVSKNGKTLASDYYAVTTASYYEDGYEDEFGNWQYNGSYIVWVSLANYDDMEYGGEGLYAEVQAEPIYGYDEEYGEEIIVDYELLEPLRFQRDGMDWRFSEEVLTYSQLERLFERWEYESLMDVQLDGYKIDDVVLEDHAVNVVVPYLHSEYEYVWENGQDYGLPEWQEDWGCYVPSGFINTREEYVGDDVYSYYLPPFDPDSVYVDGEIYVDGAPYPETYSCYFDCWTQFSVLSVGELVIEQEGDTYGTRQILLESWSGETVVGTVYVDIYEDTDPETGDTITFETINMAYCDAFVGACDGSIYTDGPTTYYSICELENPYGWELGGQESSYDEWSGEASFYDWGLMNQDIQVLFDYMNEGGTIEARYLVYFSGYATSGNSRVVPSKICLPKKQEGDTRARDFLLRLDLTQQQEVPEGMSFSVEDGAETVSIETEDGSMPELEAEAVNLWSFTETYYYNDGEAATSKFAVAAKIMEQAATLSAEEAEEGEP